MPSKEIIDLVQRIEQHEKSIDRSIPREDQINIDKELLKEASAYITQRMGSPVVTFSFVKLLYEFDQRYEQLFREFNEKAN